MYRTWFIHYNVNTSKQLPVQRCRSQNFLPHGLTVIQCLGNSWFPKLGAVSSYVLPLSRLLYHELCRQTPLRRSYVQPSFRSLSIHVHMIFWHLDLGHLANNVSFFCTRQFDPYLVCAQPGHARNTMTDHTIIPSTNNL